MANERMENLVDLIGKFVRTEGVHGAAVAVTHRGQLVLEHYEGIAGPGEQADPDTLWPLASISKLYAAATIMRLIERGELALNMTARSVLPRLHGGKEVITLRQ